MTYKPQYDHKFIIGTCLDHLFFLLQATNLDASHAKLSWLATLLV